MLYPPNDPCACGSELPAKECCFLEEPPIWRDEARITKANVNVSARHPVLGPVAVPKGLHFEMAFNVPGQLDPRIIHLGDLATTATRALLDVETRPRAAKAVARLEDALYSVRYHQRQFLFRLRKVTIQQAFLFTGSGTTSIRVNDRPMRAEFEAFLVSTAAALEGLTGLLCILLHRNPARRKSAGALLKLLREDTAIDSKVRGALRKRIEKQLDWIGQVKAYRDSAVHQEGFDLLSGVGNRGPLLLDAEVGGLLAGGLVVRTWRDLTALSEGCLNDLHEGGAF